MEQCIDIRTVAMLTGESDRRIREKVASGMYTAIKQRGVRGGNGGESYLVAVGSLPREAQILYGEQHGAITGPIRESCDLAAYRERFGEAGLEELLGKQQACRRGLAVRRLNPEDVVAQLTALAEEHGASLRTLYRWMDAYEAQGLPGIMRAVTRKDKGKPLSICPAAYGYAYGLYMNQVKRTQATIYNKLLERAEALGRSACTQCMYNEGTPARQQLMLTGEVNQYPPCTDPEKQGYRVPACRQTLGRILSAIPDDEKTLARRGKKAWKDDHMIMAIRDKPVRVNECWFGDHHQFDCFVLDEEGRPVRPWLTAWYDSATGCMVGWMLCKKPNTQTIIEAFIRAVAHTVHSPFCGVPATVYVDNGKDYRSKLFEMGQVKEQDLGYLNSNIATNSVLQLLNINVTHALPYQGWSKPVERFFGTLEDIWIREVPGWCGGSPEARPEDFSRILRQQVERGQLWTLDQLFAYLRDEVFPEYHNRPHEGYNGKTPMELYESLPRAREDQPPWSMLNVLRNSKAARRIGQQGVKFKKDVYWDDAMIGQVGKTVTVLYSEGDLSTVGIVLDGHFLCEAVPKEHLQMVGEDPEVVAEHMAKQNRQYRETRARIRRASRDAFVDEVDLTRSGGNITAIEYEKAARARTEKRAELKKPRKDESADVVRGMFAAMGNDLLRGAR